MGGGGGGGRENDDLSFSGLRSVLVSYKQDSAVFIIQKHI